MRFPEHTNHTGLLAYLDTQGALLVCTPLPGALDSYRDWINSLFFRMVSIWVVLQLNISLISGIYSRIPANTPDNFNLSFSRHIPQYTWTTKIHCQQQKIVPVYDQNL